MLHAAIEIDVVRSVNDWWMFGATALSVVASAAVAIVASSTAKNASDMAFKSEARRQALEERMHDQVMDANKEAAQERYNSKLDDAIADLIKTSNLYLGSEYTRASRIIEEAAGLRLKEEHEVARRDAFATLYMDAQVLILRAREEDQSVARAAANFISWIEKDPA